MSLQVWLPLNGNLNNQGLSAVTSTGGTVNNTGILGKCYACTSSSYITIQNPVTDKYDFSFSFWMKVPTTLSSVGAWNTMLSFRALNTNDNSTETNIDINWANYNNIKIYDDAYHQDIWMSPGDQFNYDKWCHYIITHTGNDSSTIVKVYTDGILRGTFNNSHRLVLRSGNILLGSGINPSYGPIYFNDFRLYDHCLSAKDVKEISKGMIGHWKLDNGGFGGENFILESHRVTSGSDASGITSTYMPDGSLKIVSTSGNGHWRSCGFAKDSNANVGAKLSVGDTYTISVDIKVEEGTTLPTLFINNGNGYKSLKSVTGSIPKGSWFRAYYTSTWNEPGTSYGNISLHLGFSSAIGTYYLKNFKLEKGSIPTQWCPSPLDDTTLGIDSSIESDSSGLSNNGTKIGGLSISASPQSIRYDNCYTFDGNTGCIQIPNLATMCPSGEFTMNCWIYHDDTWSSKGYETIFGGPSGFELEAKKSSTNSPVLYAYNWGQGEATYELNKWNMITMTRNASETKFYINGELKITGSAGTIPSGNYFIGAWNTSSQQNYKGKISDFRLYSTVLSVDDIKRLYDVSASIDKSGNIYAYEFKEE